MVEASCAGEQQDPQEELLRCLLVSTSHFSRCVALKSQRVPGACAGRPQGFLTSAVSRSTAGAMEAGVLPEHWHYGSFGFKRSASSLLSVFHYWGLWRDLKSIPALMARSQLYIAHLHVQFLCSWSLPIFPFNLSNSFPAWAERPWDDHITSLSFLSFFSWLSKPTSSSLSRDI